jgi:hypothetical protein
MAVGTGAGSIGFRSKFAESYSTIPSALTDKRGAAERILELVDEHKIPFAFSGC